MRKLTEDERLESNESMSESDESIHHIEEIKNIVEQQQHYTAKTKKNGTQRDFIIDTGSSVRILPLDERIIKKTEIQKMTNPYQDVNKHEVKFWGKIPVDMEYEKQTNKEWKTNHRKNRHNTTSRCGRDEEI